MTEFSCTYGIICFSSNQIIIYTYDGIRKGKLITCSILMMSVASNGQLCWQGKSVQAKCSYWYQVRPAEYYSQLVRAGRASGHRWLKGCGLWWCCLVVPEWVSDCTQCVGLLRGCTSLISQSPVFLIFLLLHAVINAAPDSVPHWFDLYHDLFMPQAFAFISSEFTLSS